MPAPSCAWNDEHVTLLKKLWKDGLSAAQIAKQIDGATRSAVIGKVHRLKLTGRVARQGAQAHRSNWRAAIAPGARNTGGARKVAAIQRAAEVVQEVVEDGLSTTSRPWIERGAAQCAWIVSGQGDGAWACCARCEPAPAWPYCDAHMARLVATPATEQQLAAAKRAREAKMRKAA